MSAPFVEHDFWKKLAQQAKKMGRSLLEQALKLFYAAQDPETPHWAKITIYATLAYLVLPLDAVPDVLPGIGYSDDLGVLAAAMSAVALYVKEEHIQKARQTLKRWFD